MMEKLFTVFRISALSFCTCCAAIDCAHHTLCLYKNTAVFAGIQFVCQDKPRKAAERKSSFHDFLIRRLPKFNALNDIRAVCKGHPQLLSRLREFCAKFFSIKVILLYIIIIIT